MIRSISRPFGRVAHPSAQPQPTTPADDGALSPSSVTDFVLQDTSSDTPHDIHPHAMAYAAQQSRQQQPGQRLPTGAVHNHPSRPRPATADERSAYIALRDQQNQTPRAGASGTTGSSDAKEPTYAQTARNVDPAFRVAPTAIYDASGAPKDAGGQASTPTPQPPQARPPSPAASEESALDPRGPALQPAPVLGSPLVLQRPQRASSLAARVPGSSAPTPSATATGRAELEIEVTGASGRRVTIRLFAP